MARKHAGNRLLAARYADAVFALGESQKHVGALEHDIEKIRHMLEISPELNKVFHNPTLSEAALSGMVEKLFKKADVSKLGVRLGAILAENGRLGIIADVLNALETRIMESKGEAKAVVTSAVKLDDEQLKDLRKSLEKRMDKKITIEAQVNPEILGGLVVKIGSKMLDSSIKGKLEQLRTRRSA